MKLASCSGRHGGTQADKGVQYGEQGVMAVALGLRGKLFVELIQRFLSAEASHFTEGKIGIVGLSIRNERIRARMGDEREERVEPSVGKRVRNGLRRTC